MPQPVALLERFINADCSNCWSDAQTPEPARGTLALDWVVPGARGDDAPLAAVAVRDGEERLGALGRKSPPGTMNLFAQRTPGSHTVRVAHGLPVADYIGTSIEMAPATGGPWKAWLVLVETLPKGTEGSPVERNLVRNTFVAEWPATATRTRGRRYELRPMHVAEGAKPQRLRLVGWLEDSRGRIRSIAQSRCGPAP